MPTRAMTTTFVESSSSGSGSREPEPAAATVLCAPRPRRVHVHPCSADLILNISNKHKEGKANKAPEVEIDGDEDGGCWALFGGSPPARADNPLVHDPHFLLNHQRHHSPSELGIFYHHLSRNGHRPTYTSSSSNSNFSPSLAPAVRIQGFDVASCRSSHGGGRVLSARA